MPLKRDPRLQPISREHHHLLVLAQLLKRGAPAYPTLPTDAPGKRAYALQEFHRRIVPLWKVEEQVLYPALKGVNPVLDQWTLFLAGENRRISNLLLNLPPHLQTDGQPPTEEDEPLVAALDFLGNELERHVRVKERQFFEEVQVMADNQLPDNLEGVLAQQKSAQDN